MQAPYLVVVGDRAAIACDAFDDVVEVEPGAMRWYRGTGERAWLLGWLNGPMCVLLDTEALKGRMRHG